MELLGHLPGPRGIARSGRAGSLNWARGESSTTVSSLGPGVCPHTPTWGSGVGPREGPVSVHVRVRAAPEIPSATFGELDVNLITFLAARGRDPALQWWTLRPGVQQGRARLCPTCHLALPASPSPLEACVTWASRCPHQWYLGSEGALRGFLQ